MLKLFASLLSMLVGGLIYLLWRNDSLLMFQWVAILGGQNILHCARQVAASSPPFDWVLFSLPNALWAFSGMLWFDLIWGNSSQPSKNAWLVLFTTTALGSEVLQAGGIVPGVYDTVDMISIVAATMLAIGLINLNTKQAKENK